MNQVEIDMVGLQPFKLLIQVAIHIGTRIDEPAGKLGSQVNLLAISSLESSAKEGLAFPVMVWVGSINVIHAVIDGIPDHLCSLFFIDIPVFGNGQAHASEAKDGKVGRNFIHSSIEHNLILMFPLSFDRTLPYTFPIF
jgi:hypothetical protein